MRPTKLAGVLRTAHWLYTAPAKLAGYCVPQLAPPVWRSNQPCAAPGRLRAL